MVSYSSLSYPKTLNRSSMEFGGGGAGAQELCFVPSFCRRDHLPSSGGSWLCKIFGPERGFLGAVLI